MNKNDQQFMAQKIRTQYMEKQPSELDTLRALDAKVKRPANVFAYVFGSVSAIIMGAGMSLVMTPIAEQINLMSILKPVIDQMGITFDPIMPLGIAIGVVGLSLAAVNYPLYKGILNARKKKYSAQIIDLSSKLMKD